MKIEINKPTIFNNDEIISGVTKSNFEIFHGKGFSIFPGKILANEEVIQHRRILAENLNSKLDRLKFQRQVHKNLIRIISRDSIEEESDGMITNIPGLILNVTIADCCAILIHDPVLKVIAALHSGWRGTSLNIAAKGISMMEKEYDSTPENMQVYLSACASGDNYEVGSEVAELFSIGIKAKTNGKYLLDIRKEIERQLVKSGIKESNIEISNVCTIENRDYHSYRRDGDKSGRMSAFIGLA